jgi:hypothetical protein
MLRGGLHDLYAVRIVETLFAISKADCTILPIHLDESGQSAVVRADRLVHTNENAWHKRGLRGLQDDVAHVLLTVRYGYTV